MSWTKVRSQIALHRKAHPNEPVPIELYQELKAQRLSAEVQRVLSTAPPLTVEQRAGIAAALLASPVGGDAA